jgi:crotonobetainyl-CoA:carnitine CoA-transferase CaiB-like acyl-CoA transferase
MYATVSVLLALRHAERTGAGQHIDLSLLDTQIAMLANQSLSWLVGGVLPGKLGNRHPAVVPYKTFEVADGTIIIAVGNDGQFRTLCDELGAPELGTDPRFATSHDRLVNRDEIESLVQELVRGFEGHPLIDRLVVRGVPAGPVNNIQEVFDDPFVEARGAVHQFVRPDGVQVPSVAFPGKFSATPAEFRYRPPVVGEHTREILSDWLALDDSELDGLVAAGAIAQAQDVPASDKEKSHAA